MDFRLSILKNPLIRLIIVIGVIAILLIPGSKMYFKKSVSNQPAPALNHHIRDESLGLDFAVSKDFERIPNTELERLNPGFVYGFRPKGIDDSACYVSQTERLKAGPVSVEDLVQGTFGEINRNYPDARLVNSQKVSLGNHVAAALEVIYNEGDGDKKIKQFEVVATTDLRTTFALCQTPEASANLYSNDFQNFLRSLQIK